MRLLAALLAVLTVPALAEAQTPAPPGRATAAQTRPHPAPHSPPHAPPQTAKPAAPAVSRPKPGAAVRKPARPAPPVPAPAPAPVAAPAPEKPAEPAKGSNSGLPLPRFAALRSEEVNFRSGPGVRYPIEWVYKRRDLPVEIEREFEVWRLVRDQEGSKGWVHQATLAPRRTAVVVGAERVLRQSASDAAGVVARLKPGVILRLRSCEAGADWCQAQTGDYRGWIKRNEIWGTYPGEAIQ